MRSRLLAALLDICCVLAFVIIGRASHAKGETLAGITSTSWPFLTGLACGWLAGRAWRQPAVLLPAGVAAWLSWASTNNQAATPAIMMRMKNAVHSVDASTSRGPSMSSEIRK